MGVFIQTNVDSPKGKACPVGYVIQGNGCWEWTGSRSPSGYGKAGSRRESQFAYRMMYERKYGPIPEGKICHHVCANPPCVNPAHIEIVTRKEHYHLEPGMRALTAKGAAMHRAKNHCPQGHPYSGENLRVRARTGHRTCRACHRVACVNFRRRRREAKIAP